MTTPKMKYPRAVFCVSVDDITRYVNANHVVTYGWDRVSHPWETRILLVTGESILVEQCTEEVHARMCAALGAPIPREL